MANDRPDMAQTGKNPVVLGRVSGIYGVRGWIKLFSYTESREAILNYRKWLLKDGDDWREVHLDQGKKHGKSVIACIAGITERDAAAGLIGMDIAVAREDMPPLTPGAYYWPDLEGMAVVDGSGRSLGKVSHLLATGANDVLVVQGEQEILVPFVVDDVVKDVDIEQCVISVDWEWD